MERADGRVVAGLGIAGSVAARQYPRVARFAVARRERLAGVYVETLANLWTIHENAQTLSAIPGAEPARPPVDRLRHIDAEVRLLGGPRVQGKSRTSWAA